MRTLRPEATVAAAVVVLLLVSALVLGLAGCGGSSDDAVPTPSPETTVSTIPVETTTPEPTTSANSTTTSSVTTTTEPLTDAETRLPDGHVQAMGFIHQIGDINKKNYVWINYAEILTGEAARAAAIEAGELSPGEEPDTDYFITPEDPKRRQFQVSDSVVITTSSYDGVTDRPITWEEFRSYWTSSAAPDTVYLRDAPWWIERDGNMVIKIYEQYLP